MKILLVDPDAKWPNPVLMKWSAWHKKRGDKTTLMRGWDPDILSDPPDKAYISCVFSWNAPKAREIAVLLPCPVEIGGYGINSAKLPDEIEHIMPDYDLYGTKYDLGSTTWGCIRGCGFCIVPKMEGRLRERASISEFHDPRHKRVVLSDNNILGLRWKFFENLRYIKEHDLKVDYNQGLDCRLFDEEIARALSEVKIDPIRFAFDTMGQEEPLKKAIELTHEYITDNYRKIIVYALFNFEDTPAEALYRVMKVRELGASPFAQQFFPIGWESDETYVSPNWREIGTRGITNFGRYWDRGFLWNGCLWEDYVEKKKLDGLRGVKPIKPLETLEG